ncbi:MAG: hypothetical protein HC831_25040 [Chloroflexia bacterium]|nr:hypothetical protein [Chloroflexia bacterium]
MGALPEFIADYTIFTNWKPSVGLRLNAQYYNVDEIYYNITDSINVEISNNSFAGRVGFASSISNSVLFTLGGKIFYRTFNSKNVDLSFPIPKSSGFGLFSNIVIDTYDRNIYPTKGLFLNMNGEYIFGELEKIAYNFTTSYWKFFLNYNQYFPISKRFIYSQFATGAVTLADNLFFSERYFLGGELNYKNYIFPLTGYHFMEIMGHNIAAAGMALRYEPWNGKFIFLQGNAGIAEDSLEDFIKPSDIYYGGSFGLGIKTIIGPIEYRISTNSYNHKVAHWIKIGYNF